MTRFNYTLNQETEIGELVQTVQEVIKSVRETYPDLDILKRGLKNGRQTATIRKGLLKAMQGQSEAAIIQIEEDWFKEQESFQTLEKELSDLTKSQEVELQALTEAKETEGVSEVELQALTDALELTETRIKILNGYAQTEIIFNPQTGQEEETVVTYKGLIEEAEEKRYEKEVLNEWLVSYRGEVTDVVRPEPALTAKITDEDVKKLIAHERDMKVRNTEDTLADLAKMNSLLFSMVSSMYEVMPQSDKDLIPADEKALIDYATSTFSTIQTRADRQLITDGISLVDKLFEREVQIADIIDEVKDSTL